MIYALHGNLGSPRDWEALDLPGLQAVDLWEWQERFPGISLEEFGEAFSEEVAASGDSEPVLLGYSLGGRLAMQALAARRDFWKGAILISTHPGLTDETEKNSRRESDREWARRVREMPWTEFLESWNAQGVLANQVVSGGQGELEGRREAVARAFESWSLGRQEAAEERLGTLGVPLLVVTGERDEKFTDLAERFRNCGNGVEVTVMPNCGHRIPMEAPDRLAEVIRDWRERVK